MNNYISDIIKEKDISQWKEGNRILICSQTGTGKSEFIKIVLYEYCKIRNKKILLMSNRNLLKNQNIEDIGDKCDLISAHNYQEFETRIIGGLDIKEIFKPYNYIVYDEAHYFFSDSQFNANTDLLIEPIRNTPKDKILIMITATPQALLDYQDQYDFVYTLPYDYSYIENIYFYNRPKNTLPIVESIIKTIPEKEKILYFGSIAEDNLRLSSIIPNSSFICSSGNKLFPMSDSQAFKDIVHLAMFNCRILFSTKILDNGVSIKDEALKHIFIDMVDPISFIQCLGRKRILSQEDNINLYVRNYNLGNLYFLKKGFSEKVEAAEKYSEGELENIDELMDLQKQTGELLGKYFNTNTAKYQHYKTQTRLLQEIFYEKSDTKYKKYICDLLDFDLQKSKDANISYEKESLKDLLDKYTGVKLFDEDIETFKSLLFDNIFTTKKTDYRSRGLRAANGVIGEDNLEFYVESRREKSGINRDKRYWIVRKNSEKENDKIGK